MGIEHLSAQIFIKPLHLLQSYSARLFIKNTYFHFTRLENILTLTLFQSL